MELSDNELISRSRRGDLGAFNMIVERYQAQVFNLSARILGNMTTAEDAAQETFISAYKALNSFRGGSLRAWLLRIASNQCYDILRASRRRPADSLDESLLNPAFREPASSDNPEQQTLQGELAEELQRAILALPEDQRTVLVLIDVQGFSYEETAEAANTSIGTVKSRLSRARARVREYLKEHRELLPDEFRQLV